MSNEAYFSVEWYSTSTVQQVIPSTQLYYSQRLGNQVHQVEVTKGPTVPSMSTIIEAPTLLTAGKMSIS
jgi:hypothetical protein